MKEEIKNTAYSTNRCEYHIGFAPKYRRQEIYGQLKKDIGENQSVIGLESKGFEIFDRQFKISSATRRASTIDVFLDHIHMLVSMPPNLNIAQFMGFLKGKSTRMIFDRQPNLKYKDGSITFLSKMLCRHSRTYERVIQEYIKRLTERRSYIRPNKYERIHRPDYGY